MLLAITLIAGCHVEDETARAAEIPRPGGPSQQVPGSAYHQLSLRRRVHWLRPEDDARKELVVWVAHPKALGKKSPSHQVIMLCDSWSDFGFEVYPGSLLEEELCRLIEQCRIGSGDPRLIKQPTRERLDWLVRRIKDRSGEWQPCP